MGKDERLFPLVPTRPRGPHGPHGPHGPGIPARIHWDHWKNSISFILYTSLFALLSPLFPYVLSISTGCDSGSISVIGLPKAILG